MWKKILISLGTIFVIIFIALTSLSLTTIAQIKKGDYFKASKTATITSIIVDPISKITFEKSSNIELLKHSLHLLSDFPEYASSLISVGDLNSDDNSILDIKNLINTLKNIDHRARTINKFANKSSVVKIIVDKKYLLKLDEISKNLPDFINTLDSLSKKNQKIIVIFQNSDELRATGGFMGSYAIINIENGKITEIVIEDIYDADGQFNGFVEAPSGVKEYLSDNKGLRLSNANWHPDFPTSAKQILQFFALGNKSNVTTIVSINLNYAKLILDISGDITLKDYGAVINGDNINEILRSKRSAFFPGSKQKKHLLSQLLTQLQIRFSDMSQSSKLEIFKQTLAQLEMNNIQLYSIDDEIDDIFSKNNFRQEMEYRNGSDYLFLVESNVGINKANRNIIRKVEIDASGDNRRITINFKNNNLPEKESSSDNHLGYINYQRIVVKPSWELNSIKQNGELILEWNENTIKNSNGLEFKEIGFITTLKEQETSILEIEFKNQQNGVLDEIKNNNPYKIYIQKQPGLPATPYTIKKDKYISQELLENDFLFKL